MKIYHYSAGTREYLGDSMARPDPMDVGSFLVPANATSITPPVERAGKARRFNVTSNNWEYVDDNRGSIIWDTVNLGISDVLNVLGGPPTGWTLKTYIPLYKWDGSNWVPDADKIRNSKNEEVNMVREKKIAEGVPYSFSDGAGTIQTRDFIDSRNIQTNVTIAMALQASGETRPVMVFRDTEDKLHQMTPAQMIAMGVAVGQYGQVIYNRSWEIKELLKGMTIAQVLAYDIEANW